MWTPSAFVKRNRAIAAALGELHVASWRESYAGLLPDRLLDGLSAEARSAMWSAVLSDPAAFGGTTVFVAESAGEIVGFGTCGSQRDEAQKGEGFDGEIGALYVLRSHQRAGVGHALMRLMSRKLLDDGHRARCPLGPARKPPRPCVLRTPGGCRGRGKNRRGVGRGDGRGGVRLERSLRPGPAREVKQR